MSASEKKDSQRMLELAAGFMSVLQSEVKNQLVQSRGEYKGQPGDEKKAEGKREDLVIPSDAKNTTPQQRLEKHRDVLLPKPLLAEGDMPLLEGPRPRQSGIFASMMPDVGVVKQEADAPVQHIDTPHEVRDIAGFAAALAGACRIRDLQEYVYSEEAFTQRLEEATVQNFENVWRLWFQRDLAASISSALDFVKHRMLEDSPVRTWTLREHISTPYRSSLFSRLVAALHNRRSLALVVTTRSSSIGAQTRTVALREISLELDDVILSYRRFRNDW